MLLVYETRLYHQTQLIKMVLKSKLERVSCSGQHNPTDQTFSGVLWWKTERVEHNTSTRLPIDNNAFVFVKLAFSCHSLLHTTSLHSTCHKRIHGRFKMKLSTLLRSTLLRSTLLWSTLLLYLALNRHLI
jgi:hypothetical protein